jgi:hypothetical protein
MSLPARSPALWNEGRSIFEPPHPMTLLATVDPFGDEGAQRV